MSAKPNTVVGQESDTKSDQSHYLKESVDLGYYPFFNSPKPLKNNIKAKINAIKEVESSSLPVRSVNTGHASC
jgi:hypothetical protein